jgi:hypothetical protein
MISPGQNGTCNSAGQNSTANGAAAPAEQGRILVPAPDSTVNPDELSELARELAAAFGETVNFYRKHYKLSTEEAVQRAAEDSPENIDRILNTPPSETSWSDLDTLAQKDAGLALKRWEQIKQAARDEIRSGHRAARAVEDGGGPWERARFAAVRTQLMEAWKPANATEQLLVDQLAQWQVLLWRWQEALTTWTTCATFAPRRAKKGERYETMRVWESDALEGAARKAELLHRLYLRTLKALQDLRRPLPHVSVRHAEQANAGLIRISVDNLLLPTGSSEQMNKAEIKAR